MKQVHTQDPRFWSDDLWTSQLPGALHSAHASEVNHIFECKYKTAIISAANIKSHRTKFNGRVEQKLDICTPLP